MRLLLFKLSQEEKSGTLRDDWPDMPSDGLTSFEVPADAPRGFYEALGYRICGTRAVRADMLERLGDTLRPLVHWRAGKPDEARPEGSHPSGGFTVTPTMMSLVGCSGDAFAQILIALGFVRQKFTAPAPDSQKTGPAQLADKDQGAEEEGPEETAETKPAKAEAVAPSSASRDEASPPPPMDAGESEHKEAEPKSAQDASLLNTPEAAAVVPTLAAEPSVSPGADTDSDPVPAKLEDPGLIDVWQPKSRRPARVKSKNTQARRGEDGPSGKALGEGAGKTGRSRERRDPANRSKNTVSGATKDKSNSRSNANRSGNGPDYRSKSGSGAKTKRRREAEFVKDSPFAALQVLKAAMEKDKTKS